MGIEKIVRKIEKIKRPLSRIAIAGMLLFSANYARAEEVARYDTHNTSFMMIEARIMQATDCENVSHQVSEIQKYSAKMNPITIRVLEDMKKYCSSGYTDCNLSGGQIIHLRCWPDGSGHPISPPAPKPNPKVPSSEYNKYNLNNSDTETGKYTGCCIRTITDCNVLGKLDDGDGICGTAKTAQGEEKYYPTPIAIGGKKCCISMLKYPYCEANHLGKRNDSTSGCGDASNTGYFPKENMEIQFKKLLKKH